jgi:hypothetical protein
MTNSEIAGLEARLHDERSWLLGKYDSGAVSAAVFAVVRQIETDLAWLQHRPPTEKRPPRRLSGKSTSTEVKYHD